MCHDTAFDEIHNYNVGACPLDANTLDDMDTFSLFIVSFMVHC